MIFIDNDNFVQIANYERILILKDLRENEVASFNYYPPEFQEEVIKMKEENMLFFDSSLFSKPEQSYCRNTYIYLYLIIVLINQPSIKHWLKL